jgi:Domain of unknown function (DUF3291)
MLVYVSPVRLCPDEPYQLITNGPRPYVARAGRRAEYVYSDAHRQVLRRRRQWFERMAEAYAALWWIPRGHVPTTQEAEEQVLHLREFGPTPYSFTLKEHFPPPGAASSGPLRSPEEWACPA